MKDTAIFEALQLELKRQRENVELIASENYVSEEVMAVQGSILTNKYAEGYPNKRYYGGCEFVDTIEDIARNRAKQLFGAKFANVQPHSGSQANMGAYRAVLEPGAKVLGMNLSHGGHLTHGHPLNFSGKDYEFYEYGVSDETETIDYEVVRQIALEVKPALIVAGASAYPRAIDFKKFREIADEVGAYLMVDMPHFAGLVAGGVYENPLLYKACSIIKEKYRNNNNVEAASEELLRIIELEGILSIEDIFKEHEAFERRRRTESNRRSEYYIVPQKNRRKFRF